MSKKIVFCDKKDEKGGSVVWYTAKEKEKAYKCFCRVIEKRDITLMDKNLYHALYQYMSFIAHYNIHGFKDEYLGNGFLRFVKHFLNPPFYGLASTGTEDLGAAMQDVVRKHVDKIFYEFENQHIKKEIELMKRLAEKHGYTVIPISENTIDLNTNVNEEGQITLAI